MKRKVSSLALLFGLLTLPGEGAPGFKVFISADMEGIVGAVTGEQLGPGGFEYERFREVMTHEVLAAIQGAKAAGAVEILVADSHGNGQNLLIEQLPEDVEVVRSWPRPLGMMEGIDDSYDAAIFIGYHASTTNPEGVRAHTLSSARLTSVALNGTAVPEAGLNAAIAGHFGVPVIMISGDDAAVAEARSYIGDIEGAVVKRAISFHSARTLHPEAAYRLIRATAERALRRLSDFEPVVLTLPVQLEMSLKHYRQAELLAYLRTVRRVDAHTISFTGRDIVEVSRFLQFVNGYSTDLQP